MSDDFVYAVGADGTVLVNGEPVEEPEPSAPVESPVDGELERLRRKVEHYQCFDPLIEAVGRGQIPIPQAQPSPDPVAIEGYRRRVNDPLAAEIVPAMKSYAAILPRQVALMLDNDPATFNATFDAFRAVRLPAPPKKAVDAFLQRKEALKDSARTLTAGTMPEVGGDTPDWKWKEAQTLKKRIRAGHRDSEVALAKMYLGND